MSQKQPAIRTVTVSSKGQITVPAALRRRLGLKRMDFAGDLAELDRELSKDASPDRLTKP